MSRKGVRLKRCALCGARCDGELCLAHSDVENPVDTVENEWDLDAPSSSAYNDAMTSGASIPERAAPN